MKKTLYTIGEALIDMTPAEVGCRLSEVSAFRPAVGGAPANVAASFAKLGGKAVLLTQLGSDAFGDKIVKELSDVGVDTGRILRTDAANTALAFVSLEKDGSRDFSFYRSPSADMLYDGSTLTENDFSDAFALSFCSVSLGDFPMQQAHRHAIRLARDAGAIVVFDPNLRFPLWKDRKALRSAIDAFTDGVDILKISDEELSFITDTDDIHQALPSLFQKGIRMVLYSCGASGAYAYSVSGAVAFSPAKKVQAVDTTGAGDAFLGAFLFALSEMNVKRDELALLRKDALFRALRVATVYSGASVTGYGAIPSYPTLAEMRDQIDL